MICQNGMLAEDVTLSSCWTQRNQMDSFFDGKETFDTKGQKVIEFYFRANGKLYCRKEKEKINPPTVIRGLATTKQGSGLIKEIFNGEEPIKFAKPLNLIKFLLSLKDTSATVLDFFAGSGTTLHAVMQLNAEDGGQRQCILVTNNENGICENVTYERNKRVINGYTKPNGDHVEGLHANNLRYYRTAYVSRNRTPQNLRRLVELSTDMLCIKENLYTECREFAGVKTRKQFFRYFEQGGKRMLIIYREEYVPDLVNLIDRLDLPDGKRIKVYVFSPSEDPRAGEFEPVEDKITLCALPMAILNAYRRVLPKRREQVIYVDQETSKKPEVPASEPTLFDMNEEGGAQ